MSRRVITHARALADLEERSEYIRRHNPRAALRFLAEAEATIGRLAAMPGLGSRYTPDHPVLADLRFFPISRFESDLVFYRPLGDGIAVIRVLHGARDLGQIIADEFGLEDRAEGDRP